MNQKIEQMELLYITPTKMQYKMRKHLSDLKGVNKIIPPHRFHQYLNLFFGL